jgi:hypothetical protein
MRELTFNHFFERFVPVIGRSPEEFPAGSTDGERHCAAMTAAVRAAYEYAFWPEILVIEERTPDSEGVVLQEEAGETRIDTVQGFFLTEEDARSFSRMLPACRIPEGWLLSTAEAAVWVRYRPVAPRFTRVKWDNTKIYAANDVAFLETNGRCYRALRETQGDYPETETADWAEEPFPGYFETVVLYAAAAAHWRYERQWSEAGEQQRLADDALFRLRAVANNQGGRL